MDKTYQELAVEISELKKLAERKRKEELTSVIRDIRQKMDSYGLTFEDISNTKAKPTSKRATSKGAGAKVKPRLVKKVPPKYVDSAGNKWTGRGKKPLWIVKHLESGGTLDTLRI